MANIKINKPILKKIDKAVQNYSENRDQFKHLAKTVLSNLYETSKLGQYIHSTKFRAKKPDHLRDKLIRKAIEAKQKNKDFDIGTDNLYSKIDDLAGVRLLHLHTIQMTKIHPAILEVLDEHMYRVIGKPTAYTWDIEYKDILENIGLKTVLRKSMYTSVHYIVEANRKTKMRCEIQVRTLMEEVWGEVSHTLNYPQETGVFACKEQLKVLARVASGCTRLVDSIFSCYEDHNRSISK